MQKILDRSNIIIYILLSIPDICGMPKLNKILQGFISKLKNIIWVVHFAIDLQQFSMSLQKP